MNDLQTCGQGLAEHAALPAKLAELVAAMAENLELHIKTLDLSDEHARREHQAYVKLTAAHRLIAKKLEGAARMMEGYRDLPMGKHDEGALAEPRISDAFVAFLQQERELITMLEESIERDEKLIGAAKG